VPLIDHKAVTVAEAFVSRCLLWGSPVVVRSDSGPEFRGAIMDAVYKSFKIHVSFGAVRHPESQGMVERCHRSLLTVFRKILDEGEDWASKLGWVLHYYRIRVHSSLGISPMKAFFAMGVQRGEASIGCCQWLVGRGA
jgi:transposase InsO family protein